MSDPLEHASPVKLVQALARHSDDMAVYYLGEGLLKAFKPSEMRCKAPYHEMGAELWEALKYELYELLCDSTKKKPRGWTTELVQGDTRNLIVALLALLAAKYEMTLAVAVPAAALIVKRRLTGLCATRVKRPQRSVKAIMSYMKRHWHTKVHASFWPAAAKKKSSGKRRNHARTRR